jgi:collagenase-like PrtC family protease
MPTAPAQPVSPRPADPTPAESAVAVVPGPVAVSRPELLAPAGDWDAMRAAVANGADAVYFGLSTPAGVSQFNARHRATNFALDELPKVVDYLHGHNVRGYVTFNTLIFSDELPEAARFVRAVAEAGLDAVIVQDLGLARLISRLAPGLHVHGSTQMTLTEPLGVEFVRGWASGASSSPASCRPGDVRKITAATDLPVEVFVHGALCVSYSGQCLTSEAIGGRSANRGQCAQACRLPYDLVVDGAHRDLGDKAYLLSPQDLAAYDIIGELADAGVCSLKIEGRLKSAHYVAATTQAYRSAIDALGGTAGLPATARVAAPVAAAASRSSFPGPRAGVGPELLPRVHPRVPRRREPPAARPRPVPQEPRRARRAGGRGDRPVGDRRAGTTGGRRPPGPNGFRRRAGPESRRRRRVRRGATPSRTSRAGGWSACACLPPPPVRRGRAGEGATASKPARPEAG